MNDIRMVSSGNVLKDYENFLNVLVQKFKIKNRETFNKDLMKFISQVVKPEYANPEEVGKLATEKKEELDEITKGFFELIDKHSGDFDFYQGAEEEINLLKQMKDKVNGR